MRERGVRYTPPYPLSTSLRAPTLTTRLQFRQSVGAVSLGDVGQEVKDTSAVAPLVAVPADQLDEVVVQGDTGLGIEDGRVGVAVQVRGDDIVLRVGKDACSMLS